VTDSVSFLYGDGSGTDFCYEREYKITSSAIGTTTTLPDSSVTIDSTTGEIKVDASNLNHDYIGDYLVEVRVTFSNW
jgi:hypothetical protein